MKRIILITGANKGIGFETARQLGQQGHTLLIGARDRAKGDEAALKLKAEGIEAHAIELDVTNDKTIQTAAEEIEEKFGKLDTLINNAGVALEGWGVSSLKVSLETWRQTFETNLFGLIAVTQRFLPLLLKSEAGRIVNLTSILGSLTLHSDPKSPIYNFKSPAYDTSKAALNSYTIHLAYDLRETPIKVNAAHPGWVKTDMGGESAPMELVDGAKTSAWLATLPKDGPSGGYFHMHAQLPW